MLNLITLGCASGYTLAAAYALAFAPEVAAASAYAAIMLTLVALCTRLAWPAQVRHPQNLYYQAMS